jgi:hypothetical protein
MATDRKAHWNLGAFLVRSIGLQLHRTAAGVTIITAHTAITLESGMSGNKKKEYYPMRSFGNCAAFRAFANAKR